jgi:excisionase family DNA binding protein
MMDNPPVVLVPLAVDEVQAAAMLGISVRTLWSYRHAGEIPVVRIGRLVRFAVDDLRRFIDAKREVSPNQPMAAVESAD